MVLIGISKDGDENRRGGGKMRHTKLDDFKPYNNASNYWRCLIMLLLLLLFMRNKNKYIENIPEVNKVQQ